MKFLFAFLALGLVAPTAVQATDKPELNGYWWAETTPGFKLGWVSGYAEAMEQAGIVQMTTCAASIPLYQQRFPNVDPKELLQRLCLSDDQFNYDGIAMGQFVDGIDAFYKDYRNKQLEVGIAIQYVRDEIRGKPAAELEAKLSQWRRCSAAYHSGNTEQMTKACAPETTTQPAK